ncbi:MAG: hypothetical protein DRP79_08745 [Planctomycetota bacterium]|nr:MAG: hypothetical protein DRP79_08745 [Planctomycetota bacterium]
MRPKTKTILWVLFAGVAARILFAFLFPPFLASDSHSYLELAEILTTGDFSRYNGARTPVYPLLLSLLCCNTGAIIVFQAVSGLFISVLLVLISQKIHPSRKAALAAGLSYALNPAQIVIERAVLAETTATLFITLSVFLYFKTLEPKTRPSTALSLGVTGSVAGLTKPLFAFLAPLFAFLLAGYHFFSKPAGKKTTGAKAILVIIPWFLLLGSWSWFNYHKTGYFGVTTLAGYNLMNHTGAFIEHAPEKYDTIKNIFLKYRETRLKESGTASMTIWTARQELMRETGLNFVELSRTLLALSEYLILHHPLKYLKSVAGGFGKFWFPAWYTNQGGIRAVISSGDIPMVLLVSAFVLAYLCCTMIFLAWPFLNLLYIRVRKIVSFDFKLFSIYALVLLTALLQALMEFGENSRYKLPVEPLMVACAVWFLFQLFESPPFSQKTKKR